MKNITKMMLDLVFSDGKGGDSASLFQAKATSTLIEMLRRYVCASGVGAI